MNILKFRIDKLGAKSLSVFLLVTQIIKKCMCYYPPLGKILISKDDVNVHKNSNYYLNGNSIENQDTILFVESHNVEIKLEYHNVEL